MAPTSLSLVGPRITFVGVNIALHATSCMTKNNDAFYSLVLKKNGVLITRFTMQSEVIEWLFFFLIDYWS